MGWTGLGVRAKLACGSAGSPKRDERRKQFSVPERCPHITALNYLHKSRETHPSGAKIFASDIL